MKKWGFDNTQFYPDYSLASSQQKPINRVHRDNLQDWEKLPQARPKPQVQNKSKPQAKDIKKPPQEELDEILKNAPNILEFKSNILGTSYEVLLAPAKLKRNKTFQKYKKYIVWYFFIGGYWVAFDQETGSKIER